MDAYFRHNATVLNSTVDMVFIVVSLCVIKKKRVKELLTMRLLISAFKSNVNTSSVSKKYSPSRRNVYVHKIF